MERTHLRPLARGKFLFLGKEKFSIRGVTYGPFRPDAGGCEYHTPERVALDFAQMHAHGINTVRTYTVPPRWLLDLAAEHDLYVMVGLPWEQHVTFLDDATRARAIVDRVRTGVRRCAGHPAVLAYTVGNEIPPSIVRWYGRRRVERFVERLYDTVKAEDPDALVTYVTFPTTEYLQLPCVDFVCFNVYLESPDAFEAYLARLQNLAGDRPLVMAEIGLDSRRNGLEVQAESLDWQIRTAFAAGCAGVFTFAWTDEWHRGGHDIDDWDFGLTDRGGLDKPALEAVERAYADAPLPADRPTPRISVIVCSYNGAATIGETLDALERVDYPNFEVLVVDDGSTDATAEIASGYGVRLLRSENHGLSAARNTGLAESEGEIVVYLDDDAYPDPDWLSYLADLFMRTDYAAVGGPNLAPPEDGFVAAAVDHAPGNPIHVLVSDREAEHIPGCNFAVRREALAAIGGFDTRFRIAGDDVDACWRLQEAGGRLGYHPAAVVWHHRRSTVREFWKQQKNYGKAEALLEQKWPKKYNRVGHLRWNGHVYTGGLPILPLFRPWRIYYGIWGSALFQSIYARAPGLLGTLPLMPEWYLLLLALGLLTTLGLLWPPLLGTAPLLLLAVAVLLVQAYRRAGQSLRGTKAERPRARQAAATMLHLMQPLARLVGRFRQGLTPWRVRGASGFALPRPRTVSIWSEQWRAPERWLSDVEQGLRATDVPTARGGDYDRWDLETRCGLFGGVRLRMAIEEHGGGRQMARFRVYPALVWTIIAFGMVFTGLGLAAALDGAGWAAVALLLTAGLVLGRKVWQLGAATATVLRVLKTEHVRLAAADREAAESTVSSSATVPSEPAPHPNGAVPAATPPAETAYVGATTETFTATGSGL